MDFVNKNNGDTLKLIPTEETIVKNKFINNICLDNESTFFLNTFGSLYSIDNNKMRINWFINLNENSNIRYQVKPFMIWIWVSVILISFGGFLSFFKKRYEV